MDLHFEANILPSFKLLERIGKREFELISGKIFHSSGLELYQHQKYSYLVLPEDGEWLSMSPIHILCYSTNDSSSLGNLVEEKKN